MLRMVLIAAVMAVGMSRLPGAPVDGDTVTIVNSGSTNRAGFRITVDRSGNAVLTSTPRRFGAGQTAPEPVRQTLPADLVKSFFTDLAAARPLGALPAVHCPRSASFGSVLTVALGEEQSPDLSCGDGGHAAMRDLIRDTNQIVALLLK